MYVYIHTTYTRFRPQDYLYVRLFRLIISIAFKKKDEKFKMETKLRIIWYYLKEVAKLNYISYYFPPPVLLLEKSS